MAVEAVVPPRPASAKEASPGRTWWLEPALTVVCYSAFVIYASWSVFSGTVVAYDPYVSPFFSTWLGFGLIKVPIIGILIPFLAVIPLGLRGSCYYYRKSYFRSFFWDPPACAIQELKRGRYHGETRFPWVLNNYHRYFLLLSLIVLFFLWIDVVRAFIYHGHFFLGLGSVVMLVNVILLSLYSLTCHSFRYLMGGRIDRFSRARAGRLWHRLVMLLNRANPQHGAWAWYSMFSVALTDVYIRLLMAGVIHEPRVIFCSQSYQTLTTDVLVIGAGGAGMRAAIEAAAAGARVDVVCKSLLGKAHTVMAEGGIAAALGNVDPEDNWEVHFQDTMRGGQMINNWRMAELHSRESPDRVYELETYGAIFDRTPDGRILQRAFGAHTFRRLCHVGDRTGLEMIRSLQDRIVQLGIELHMEVTLTRLLKDGDRVIGAFGYNRIDGAFVAFHAKAVIIATGGWGRLYKVTSNSWEGTGDGVGMGFDAGAEVLDPEMVQFHPTGMVWPPGVRGILVTEAVRGEGGTLTNREGKRFMLEIDPQKKELSSRDVVARAIYKEVQAGRGTEHGGAYLNVRHLGAEKIKKKLPSMYEQFLRLADVDITKAPMEVAPTIHYAMGGLRVDAETGATTLPGLYAAGEAAAGLHGANRLGGNSLSDLLVFGRRAGAASAAYQRDVGLGTIDERQVADEQQLILLPLVGVGKENPYLLQQELQEAMQDGAGLAREEKSLKTCLDQVLELRQRAARIHVPGSRKYNPGWHTARDLRFMLTIAEAIVRAAIERRESRGAHWRLDYLEKDPALGRVNFIAYSDGGRVKLKTRPVPEMPPELARLFADSASASKPPAPRSPKPQPVRK